MGGKCGRFCHPCRPMSTRASFVALKRGAISLPAICRLPTQSCELKQTHRPSLVACCCRRRKHHNKCRYLSNALQTMCVSRVSRTFPCTARVRGSKLFHRQKLALGSRLEPCSRKTNMQRPASANVNRRAPGIIVTSPRGGSVAARSASAAPPAWSEPPVRDTGSSL